MDRPMIRLKIKELYQKYKYIIVVLLAGMILLIIPSKKTETALPATQAAENNTPISASVELEQILGQIYGVGKVRVMLSVLSGEETIYQTNDQTNSEPNRATSNSTTVIRTDAQRNQTGMVRQVNPPKYLGAIVICQGADSASVRLAVLEAVSKITGLRTDQISVLKMK